VTSVIAIVAFSLLSGCSDEGGTAQTVRTHLSREQAVEIGLDAIENEMTRAHAEKYWPYQAEFKEGFWHVFGTVPGGGPGGTPEAVVQDGDGKVVSVVHGQ